uniref:Uncharacterized protein n=1 Tax=Manihot esculenta TaxID=3983 RepID=A0A251KTP8_MANES
MFKALFSHFFCLLMKSSFYYCIGLLEFVFLPIFLVLSYCGVSSVWKVVDLQAAVSCSLQ